MRKRKLGRTELQVSEIGFGALEIGRPWGLPIEGDFVIPSERDVQALLDRALSLGINLIDTAPAYMLSEERLGRLLKRRRKEFYLASKCGERFDGYESHYDFSTAGTVRSIEASLKRLETDYLDLVQIHCGPDEVETIRRGETLEGMLRAKRDGKVRWVGVSCEAKGACVALEMKAYDTLQLPYSLLERSIEQPEAGGESVLSRAARLNVGVLVREPLARGKLTDKIRQASADGDPAVAKVQGLLAKLDRQGLRAPLSRLAVQFALRRPEVATVLVGTRSARHVEDAVEAAGQLLGPDTIRELETLASEL
jgi:aryl-alcohol dehydrogenase-like predicted oxidoreductase